MIGSVLLLADHGLITAIPFVVPALVLAAGLVVLIVRDRRHGGQH